MRGAYGISAIVPAIAEFKRHYPNCKVDAVLTDRSLDLISGQVELAIRVRWLTQFGMQARQLGTLRQLLVAAPTWQRQGGKADALPGRDAARDGLGLPQQGASGGDCGPRAARDPAARRESLGPLHRNQCAHARHVDQSPGPAGGSGYSAQGRARGR
ncbi:TPA: hypothetical protein QEM76_005638 [Pseudomonas putida]|nr:hypothetical protein [Pseudomonas putida]HDS1802919.1 hypothetical protein [Pseudomonas putida]HDS1808851.1 hypothetical protein [Pseudomonas putida]